MTKMKNLLLLHLVMFVATCLAGSQKKINKNNDSPGQKTIKDFNFVAFDLAPEDYKDQNGTKKQIGQETIISRAEKDGEKFVKNMDDIFLSYDRNVIDADDNLAGKTQEPIYLSLNKSEIDSDDTLSIKMAAWSTPVSNIRPAPKAQTKNPKTTPCWVRNRSSAPRCSMVSMVKHAKNIKSKLSKDLLSRAVETTTEDSNEIKEGNIEEDTINPFEDNDLEDGVTCEDSWEKKSFPKRFIEKQGRRVSEYKCEEYTWLYKQILQEADEKYQYILECRKKKGQSLVIGGKNSIQGDFPHMGAVGWPTKGNGTILFCGSSLISHRFALTAAHCSWIGEESNIYSSNSLISSTPSVVRFGNVNVQDSDVILRDVPIEDILVPDKYIRGFRYHDIGLIKLAELVVFTQLIRPACLWQGGLEELTVGNITGWGKFQSGSDNTSTHLKYAEIDFIDRKKCKSLPDLKTMRIWQYGLAENQFCAGKLEGGVDTCQGDSGGPVQVRRSLPSEKNAFMHHVVGITNFGKGCAWPNLPGIYANVSSYLCWIERIVWPNEKNSFCNGSEQF